MFFLDNRAAAAMHLRFQFSIRTMLAATAAVGGALALWRTLATPYSLAIVVLVVAAAPLAIGLALRRACGRAKAFCQVAIFPAILTLSAAISVIGRQAFGLNMDYPKILGELHYSVMCEGTDTLTMAQDNLVCWFGVTMLAGLLGVLIRHPDNDDAPNKMDRNNSS